MESIHAHEILRMMEEKNFQTTEELKDAIDKEFGKEALFYTCSVSNLNTSEIIEFLESRGKFKPSGNGFTMDKTQVCETY